MRHSYLSEIIRLLHVSEHMFDKRMQDIQTVDLVAFSDGQIKTHQRNGVRLWDA